MDAQQIIETARLMAKDITRKELEDEAYRREKMTEARKFIDRSDYRLAIDTLGTWKHERENLFGKEAQALLREAVDLEAKAYKGMMMDRAREFINRQGRRPAIRFLEDWEAGRETWHGWGASYSYFPRKDLFDQDARALLLELKHQEKEEEREERKRKEKEDREKLEQVRSLISHYRTEEARKLLEGAYFHNESSRKEAEKLKTEVEKLEKDWAIGKVVLTLVGIAAGVVVIIALAASCMS